MASITTEDKIRHASGGFYANCQIGKADYGEPRIPKFMAVLWAVWRSKNGTIYGNEKQSIKVCQEYWRRALEDIAILACGNNAIVGPNRTQIHAESQSQGICCYVDGSWDETGATRIGLLAVWRGSIIIR